jgi:hypothetical protein
MKKIFYFLGAFILIGCSKLDKLDLNYNPDLNTLVKLDSIKVTQRIDTLIISKGYKYTVTGYYSNKTTKDFSDSVTISTDKPNLTISGNSFIMLLLKDGRNE